MTAAELTTAVQENANVKVAIMNNSFLGMGASGRNSSSRSATLP